MGKGRGKKGREVERGERVRKGKGSLGNQVEKWEDEEGNQVSGNLYTPEVYTCLASCEHISLISILILRKQNY